MRFENGMHGPTVTLPDDAKARQRIGKAIELDAYVSAHDGAIVVHIDTAIDARHLRVNVNDGVVFDGDPESPTLTREQRILGEIEALLAPDPWREGARRSGA